MTMKNPGIAAVALMLSAAMCFTAAPVFAQNPQKADHQSAKSAGATAGGAKDSAADGYIIRVKLGDEAHGEFACKDGEPMKDSVAYKTFKHSSFAAYAQEAAKSGLIKQDKAASASNKTKALAAKLAFLQKADEAIKKKINELEAQKAALEYKKAVGAGEMIKNQWKDAVQACKEDKSGALNCPAGDSAQGGGAPQAATGATAAPAAPAGRN